LLISSAVIVDTPEACSVCFAAVTTMVSPLFTDELSVAALVAPDVLSVAVLLSAACAASGIP